MSKSDDNSKNLSACDSESENASNSCQSSKKEFHDDESSPPGSFPDTDLLVITEAGPRECDTSSTSDMMSDDLTDEDLISSLQTPCSVDHRPDNFWATPFPAVCLREESYYFIDFEKWLDNNFIENELPTLCNAYVQRELAETKRVTNWWVKDPYQNTSLIAFKNRANGECLLDSVSQTIFGHCDLNGIFRELLAKSFRNCLQPLYNVFAWNTQLESRDRGYEVCENIIRTEFLNAFRYALTPRSYLEEIHIFLLANIIRRPIILYSVKQIVDSSGDALQDSTMAGIYLPLFVPQNLSLRDPIILGYTLNHFSALVPVYTYGFRSIPLFYEDGEKLPIKYARCLFNTDDDYSLGPNDSLEQRMRIFTDDLGRQWAVL